MTASTKRWPVVTALIIGLGLMAAPVVFQMFGRAPLGGDMIDEFRPYMVAEKIDTFRGYMATIDDAIGEGGELRQAVIDSGTMSADDFDTQFVFMQKLSDEWPAIDADMTDLLDRMDTNMDNYAAVAALPPFPLFPWFFVIPGALIAGLATSVLLSERKGRRTRRRWWALGALGLGLILAPLVFQMFTRAPKGAEMIDDFRPMMTRERVQSVQGYFVTLGGGEGQIRVGALPAYVAAGGDAAGFPALAAFSEQWPTIVADFNPMIATMSDNVDNFEAVDALPSFALFPWFFVIPGALVVTCAAVAIRRSPTLTSPTLTSRSDT